MVKLRALWTILILAALVILAVSPVKADAAKVRAAQKAAEDWLALVDGGRYGESWEQAASLFRSKVGKRQWEAAAEKVRGPLGGLQSRKVASSQYVTELPGAPDGEYVVLQYQSSFEEKKNAVETIVPMLDKDGAWRVSGYYIK
jgi:hypothetical protein